MVSIGIGRRKKDKGGLQRRKRFIHLRKEPEFGSSLAQDLAQLSSIVRTGNGNAALPATHCFEISPQLLRQFALSPILQTPSGSQSIIWGGFFNQHGRTSSCSHLIVILLRESIPHIEHNHQTCQKSLKLLQNPSW